MAAFGGSGCGGGCAWVAVVGVGTGCYSRRHGRGLLHASCSSHLALLDVSHGDHFLHAAKPLTPSPPAAAPPSPTDGSIFFPNRRWRPSPPCLQRLQFPCRSGRFVARRWQSGMTDTGRSSASCL